MHLVPFRYEATGCSLGYDRRKVGLELLALPVSHRQTHIHAGILELFCVSATEPIIVLLGWGSTR